MDDENVVYLRTTERRSYAACRQQWWWSFIDRLKSVETGPALKFGDLCHQALGAGVPSRGWEPWYRPGRERGTHPVESFVALYEDAIEDGMADFSIKGDDESVNAKELGVDMLESYVDYYGADDSMRIIAPEMPAQIPLTDKYGRQMMVPNRYGRMVPIVYVCTFDAVYEDLNTGRIGLLETKTAASISTYHLGLDEQAGSYWAFAPKFLADLLESLGKDDLDFIMYNFLRKSMRDTRPVNEQGHRLNKPSKDVLLDRVAELGLTLPKNATIPVLVQALEDHGEDPTQLGEVSKVQPPPFFVRQPVYRDEADRANLMTRIRMQAWEMGKVRIGELPVYKNPALTWPDQHCNGCEFRDMCQLHETGSDWEELRDLTMTHWDPYEDHREATED